MPSPAVKKECAAILESMKVSTVAVAVGILFIVIAHG